MLHRLQTNMRCALILLVFAVGLAGCSNDERKRTTVLLFDVSGSVRSAELETRYHALIDQIVTTAEPGDRVAGDRISAHSHAQARLALDQRIPPPKNGENRHFYENRLEAARDSLRQQAEALLDAPAASCTDLLGAFDLTARMLRGSDAAEKRLVVASDMVQTCGEVDFRRADLSEHGITALIERERAVGRLPDLSGVSVWVAGAGTDTTVAPARHRAIERFWQAYFAAAEAELAPERYAPTLLHWP